jgi:hypothetical protein
LGGAGFGPLIWLAIMVVFCPEKANKSPAGSHRVETEKETDFSYRSIILQ